MQAAKRV